MKFTTPALAEPPAGPSLEVATHAPTVLVTAAGGAEGSRAAAAALACVGAEGDRATLLVDLGGKAPRPTLIASEASRRLEQRLAAHLPTTRVSARGQVCCLATSDDADGLAVASAAATVARGSLCAVHVPPVLVQEAVAVGVGPRFSGVLLRADLERDRALVALAAHGLLARDLRLAVLKRPLSWVAARRAHFGVLATGSPGGLPEYALALLGLR
jgi:hypothetical protein